MAIILINTFTVSPERQQELIDLLNDATEKTMRHVPGFISATIHQSLDGQRVVNYAQWESEDAFKKMMGNEEAKKHMGKASAMAHADPHMYRIVKTHST